MLLTNFHWRQKRGVNKFFECKYKNHQKPPRNHPKLLAPTEPPTTHLATSFEHDFLIGQAELGKKGENLGIIMNSKGKS